MNIYTLLAEGTTIAYSLEQFMTDVTSVFGSAMDMAGQAMEFITSNGITLAFCAVPLVGIGVGLVKRFINN